MTLEEYQKKHARPYNEKAARTFLFIIAAAIALIVIFCLFSIVKQTYELFEKNVISLYVSIPIAVIIFILIYVVPLIKINSYKPFITDNVNSGNIREAKKHNKQLRENIADKMIDLQAKTNDVDWYNEQSVGQLAIARHTKDDAALRAALGQIYNNDVKKAANRIIRRHALRVGITTALSQNEKIDTLFSITFNLGLIKNLVYLYGFRPNDKELVKIYQSVIVNSLVAYGSGQLTVSLGSAVVKKMGKVAESVPFFGALVGTAVDSVSQGIINGIFTIIVGFQVKRYLVREYHLQDILEDVTLEEESESEINEIAISLKDDIISSVKSKKGQEQAA